MRKLLIGLTLLASMSTYANQVPADCSIVVFGTDQPVSLEGHDKILKEKYDVVENNARFHIHVNGLCDEGTFFDDCGVNVEVVTSEDNTTFAEAMGYSDISYSRGVKEALENLPACK